MLNNILTYHKRFRSPQVLETHDAARPLFVFWAPHIVHSPLQVPRAYLEGFAAAGPTDNHNHARQIYAAMASLGLGRSVALDCLLIRFIPDALT